MAHLIGKSPVATPVLVVGKLAFLGSFLFIIVKRMYPESVLYDSLLTRVTGVALFTAGLVMVITALIQLGQSASVGLPEEETELKTRGLYRYTRNPVYLGAFIMCAGSCFYSIHIVNVLLFGIALATHIAIVKREEEFLEKRFGQRWLEYKKRVPRFAGMLRRSNTP